MRVIDRVSGGEHWRIVRSTPLEEDGERRLAVTVIEDRPGDEVYEVGGDFFDLVARRAAAGDRGLRSADAHRGTARPPG